MLVINNCYIFAKRDIVVPIMVKDLVSIMTANEFSGVKVWIPQRENLFDNSQLVQVLSVHYL